MAFDIAPRPLSIPGPSDGHYSPIGVTDLADCLKCFVDLLVNYDGGALTEYENTIVFHR